MTASTLKNRVRRLSALLLVVSLSVSGPLFADSQKELEREMRVAATVGDDDALINLVERGADVNAANEFGKTALMNAV